MMVSDGEHDPPPSEGLVVGYREMGRPGGIPAGPPLTGSSVKGQAWKSSNRFVPRVSSRSACVIELEYAVLS